MRLAWLCLWGFFYDEYNSCGDTLLWWEHFAGCCRVEAILRVKVRFRVIGSDYSGVRIRNILEDICNSSV